MYLVNRDAQGLEFQSKLRVDGGFWGELKLNSVSVNQASEIASAASGALLLERMLDEARLGVSAEIVGLMSHALEISVEYIKTRKQFGSPVGSFQALQHRAVNLYVLVEVARSVLLRSAGLFDESEDRAQLAAAASQVKARCSARQLRSPKDVSIFTAVLATLMSAVSDCL